MNKLIGFLVLCSSCWILGQNYLTNGEFTQNLDDWETSGVVGHSNEGYGSPGSARFPLFFLSQIGSIEQCGRILDSLDYKASAWIKSSGHADVTLTVHFFESSDCTVEIGSKTILNSYTIPSTEWVFYSFSLGTIPVGSLGAKLVLKFQNKETNPIEILVSSIFLGRFHHASDDRNITTIAKTGDILANTNGLPVVKINRARTSANGDLVFSGETGNGGPTEFFLWQGDGVVLNPTLESGFSRFGGGGVALDNLGNWVASTIETNTDILWSSQGEILRENNPFPPLPGYEVGYFFGVQPSGANNFTFNMVLSSMRKNGGSIEAIVQVDDPANPVHSVLYKSGGLIEGETIVCTTNGVNNYAISTNGQHHVVNLLLEGGEFILARNGQIILREGQANNIQREWRLFSRMAINNQGDYLNSGSLVSAPNLSPRVFNAGDLDLYTDRFLQANDEVFITSHQKWNGIRLQGPCHSPYMKINNHGEAVVFWFCQEEGYWFYIRDIAAPAATATLILKSGDILDLDGDNIPESTVDAKEGSSALHGGFDIDDNGQISIATSFGSFSPYSNAVVTFERPCIPGLDFYEALPTWPSQSILSFFPLDCETP